MKRSKEFLNSSRGGQVLLLESFLSFILWDFLLKLQFDKEEGGGLTRVLWSWIKSSPSFFFFSEPKVEKMYYFIPAVLKKELRNQNSYIIHFRKEFYLKPVLYKEPD